MLNLKCKLWENPKKSYFKILLLWNKNLQNVNQKFEKIFKQNINNYKSSLRFESRKKIQFPQISYFGENDDAKTLKSRLN